ncbi:3-hydroxybutyryl-CoA dehydrogenase [Nocardiopsis mwathae]|uniref:3-hydroxybutyryl-CoA dehydrogenase n=1 Tax=Nocardiopsis mwathae TaxID=1472723 RepID=A0A7W9YGW7_9ACTN|nr:3-hydroxyacyl-CoA dehydrogenase family protein [Nocardiopsis mwathae]MBB6171869.1 3-hydroxybutyryl-CoA dehydrogenase [Nocardiopsis mwathae]
MSMDGTPMVGIVGSGVMGVGTAQSLVQSGHDVVMVDLNQEILDRAAAELARNMRLSRLLAKPGQEQAVPTAGKVSYAVEYDALAPVDFVIENITEKWELKKDLYPVLDEVCRAEVCFAANTSCTSITRLGSLTARPAQVIGMHFMNPVPLKPAVEVIMGHHTSADTLDTAKDLLASMGKEAIVVNDSPGFVSNRVLMPTINEAIYLVQEQVASPAEIDRLFERCFGHAMGPLQTADLIGVDTILHSLEVLYEDFNDSKYRPCPLLRRMVDAGLHGRKTGQGFFTYQT